MRERILGPTGGWRRRRLLVPLLLVAVVGLALGIVNLASAGPVGTAIGFEDDDGNLAVNSTFDWNGFSPVTWSPHPATEPTRQTDDKTVSGFQFKGIEDWQATTSDTAFAGGTKQDDECATVGTGKAPNKDDLKRIYLASKTGADGHTYLELAWVRIPQNTTSPSAHIGFEFNQGDTECGGSSDGLVERTRGDMLIVYDFEGGTTDVPTLTLRRWVDGTVTGDSCEVGSHTPPCWGPATNLTAGGFAEGKVNTTATAVDTLTPPALSSSTGTSVSSTLGLNEFGEAGIDLTGAGVFAEGTCASFGKAFGVSRSSGNSDTAQMKDLVGPADFSLSNCGEIKIIKHTDPPGVDQNFDFTSTIAGSELSCSPDTTPASFTLNDSADDTEDCTNVPAGSYTVTEGADPTGFTLKSLSCTASSGSSGSQDATDPKKANITLIANGLVTCTYVNQQQLGAIKITKKSSKDNSLLQGATFSIKDSNGDPISGSPFTSDANGEVCVDGLAFGDYSVQETAPPDGYKADDATAHTVTVDNSASCGDDPFVGETIEFTDTPLSEIEVQFRSLAGAGVTTSSIVCEDSTPATVDPVSENGDPDPASDDTDETFTDLEPGTYKCTVVVDP
jgi:Prealbumin-like fold domain